jgi:hypothetical protein
MDSHDVPFDDRDFIEICWIVPNWSEFCGRIDERRFKIMFRMPLSAFNKLEGIMEERLGVEKFKSEVSKTSSASTFMEVFCLEKYVLQFISECLEAAHIFI